MGKKKPEEMAAKQRKIFVKGAKDTNNIERKKADEIFDILEKFAGYGFNKSHSLDLWYNQLSDRTFKSKSSG